MMLNKRAFLIGSAALGLLPGEAFAAHITGPSRTYTDAELGTVVRRSNAGQPMFDVLPGNPAISDGYLTVYNQDAVAPLVINTGTILDEKATNFLMLGPTQSAQIYVEAGEYRTVSKPLLSLLGQNTRIYIDNVNGSDYNPGITRTTALKTLQGAWDLAHNWFHLNHFRLEFYLINTGVDYTPGVLAWDLFQGQPADYGVFFRGENSPIDGSFTQIVDRGPGTACFVCAGGAQIYPHHLRLKSFGSAPCVKAEYNGFISMDRVMFMGTDSNFMEVHTYGRIEINNFLTNGVPSIWMIVSSGTALCALSAASRGSISITKEAQCIILGQPHFTWAFASATNGGYIDCACDWSGTVTGRKWIRWTGGGFITGFHEQALDSYMPGNLPGESDLTGFNR